jgi:hypothetical protein
VQGPLEGLAELGGGGWKRSGSVTAGGPPYGSASTRGSWRAGMTDRATSLRRLPEVPDVVRVEQLDRGSVSFVGDPLVLIDWARLVEATSCLNAARSPACLAGQPENGSSCDDSAPLPRLLAPALWRYLQI